MQSTPLRDRRPIALQLRDSIRELIRTEDLGPGARLPSETDLATRFGVARGSIREAFKLLEQDGLIDVRHGLGRFVSAAGGLAVSRPVTMFESVTDMLRARGLEPTTRVLSVERALPSAAERVGLELGDGEEVVRLRRLRVLDDRLLVLSLNVFPARVLGSVELHQLDLSVSLNEQLAHLDHRPVSAAAELRAAPLPDDVADRPEVQGEQQWLLITERCVDANGVPVLLSEDYHRGDVFSFHVLRRRGT